MSTQQYICDRLLLTNDDGIDAPGLRVLETVASQLAREVWVVAPMTDQSGTSHSISIHDPLRVATRGERRFALSGTPGDCIAWALGHLLTQSSPDIVLSGINRGANLGRETVFSGTVGAAMTGLLFNVPSIALSQAFFDRENVPWENALSHAPSTLRQLVTWGWPGDVCLNVNFPACSSDDVLPLRLTSQGRGTLKEVAVQAGRDPRSHEYYWLKLHREPLAEELDAEAACLQKGHITATPLTFERTHIQALAAMRSRQE